jgi:aminoglycoside phosphotransferase (APT) family kinase protein
MTRTSAPASLSDQSGLLEALRDCGLLEAGEAAVFTPLTGGVSSDVFKAVTQGGRAMVVKRSIPRLRVAAQWLAPVERAQSETAWIETARAIDERFAPRILAVLAERHLFVMEYLDGATHPVWKEVMASGSVDVAFAGKVGRDLALIHARTAGRGDIRAKFNTDKMFFALRISPFLLHAAKRHADVAARVRALAADLAGRKIALAHGDISPKNILVGPDGPVFLDAECAVYGDPAFDLAFCLSHLLLKTVWLRDRREAVMAAFDALRDAYGAGVTWEAARATSRRAAALIGALLLARVDGKSPAPYLTRAADKALVRRGAKRLLTADGLDLDGVARLWSDR